MGNDDRTSRIVRGTLPSLSDVLNHWEKLDKSNNNNIDILSCVEHEDGEHALALKSLLVGQKRFRLVTTEIVRRLGPFIEV